jgi:hypothetical protein
MDKKNVKKVGDSKSRSQAVVKETIKTAVKASAPSVEQTLPSTPGQEIIEDAKFYMGQQPWPVAPSPRELPHAYGDNRIVLMIVDAWWAYSYWEVAQDKIQEGLRFLGAAIEATKSVLRVYDVTGLEGTDRSNHSFDIELRGLATGWYIHVNPERSYRVDIGLLTQDGRFFTLARSNTITLPRISMSEIVDERWMSQEFEKMYALSGGLKVGAGSVELKEQMEKRFHEVLFSGAVSSFGGSPVKKKERSFWFVLDAELIVYGATEPDAQVTVCGRPIQLRPDGTFTLRYALPDGKFPIPATARSGDGKEERTITPIVQRNTEVSQPIVKP